MSGRRLRITDQPPAATDLEADPATDSQADGAASLRHRHAPPSPMAERVVRPRSRGEAEERYVAARDAWTDAMRAAGSGRPAELAALAMAQETYEAALAERERWASSPTVAVPIEVATRPAGIDAVVGQELSWRRVHEHEQEREQAKARRGIFGRLFRR